MLLFNPFILSYFIDGCSRAPVLKDLVEVKTTNLQQTQREKEGLGNPVMRGTPELK